MSITSFLGRDIRSIWGTISSSPTVAVTARSDLLPAFQHLAAWVERNSRFGDQIGEALEEKGIVSQFESSKRVTEWAYGQTEAAGGLTWVRGDEVEPLKP
jgi:hypothetical protein